MQQLFPLCHFPAALAPYLAFVGSQLLLCRECRGHLIFNFLFLLLPAFLKWAFLRITKVCKSHPAQVLKASLVPHPAHPCFTPSVSLQTSTLFPNMLPLCASEGWFLSLLFCWDLWEHGRSCCVCLFCFMVLGIESEPHASKSSTAKLPPIQPCVNQKWIPWP